MILQLWSIITHLNCLGFSPMNLRTLSPISLGLSSKLLGNKSLSLFLQLTWLNIKRISISLKLSLKSMISKQTVKNYNSPNYLEKKIINMIRLYMYWRMLCMLVIFHMEPETLRLFTIGLTLFSRSSLYKVM